MRITTWNVNGLRAVLGKGLLNLIQPLQSDVLCLQEIKARPDQLESGQLEFDTAESLKDIGSVGSQNPRFAKGRPAGGETPPGEGAAGCAGSPASLTDRIRLP